MCHGWRASFLPWKHLTLLRISRSVSLYSVAAQSHAFTYLKVSVAAQHQAFSYLKVSERVRSVLLHKVTQVLREGGGADQP